jgi:hypothetical protein
MAEAASTDIVLDALLRGLSAQGQGERSNPGRDRATAFPIKGTIDVVALAEAVGSALRGGTSDEEKAKTPAELNAANDG